MRYTLQDIEEITRMTAYFADGEFNYWLRAVWMLMVQEGMDCCESRSEHIRFYSMLYGICKIYRCFMDKIEDSDFDSDPDLEIDYAKLCDVSDEEEAEICHDYLWNLICDSDNMRPVFHLLRRKMNAARVFAALYYSWNYAAYSLEDYETDEFYYGDIEDERELEWAKSNNEDYEFRKQYADWTDAEIMDEIMNDLTVDKCVAYEWIAGNM